MGVLMVFVAKHQELMVEATQQRDEMGGQKGQ
jgi:hypothetical protein